MSSSTYLLTSHQNLVPAVSKPSLSGARANAASSFQPNSVSAATRKPSTINRAHRHGIITASSENSFFTFPGKKTTSVLGTVTVLKTSSVSLGTKIIDGVTDFWFGPLLIGLVAAQIKSESGRDIVPVSSYAHWAGEIGNEIYFHVSFEIPNDFGEIGAVTIENEHLTEMFVKDIKFHGLSTSVDNINDELRSLKGTGTGERKESDRIYDYDVYNDLGNPDANADSARPVLGGTGPDAHPYPRRCRTGRPGTKKEACSESKGKFTYVPRDEAFSQVKDSTFHCNTVSAAVHALIPGIKSIVTDKDAGFPHFTAIDNLFDQDFTLPDEILKFETPEFFDKDKFSWFRDSEFARQALAGVNPCYIKLVTEWPLTSKLDPGVYGPAESAITTELVEKEIGGYMTVNEALKQKKLFLLDYHDLLLPYVNKVREIKGTTLYGSRTLFFLTPAGTLRPLAIELTRPPADEKPQWKQVFQPCWQPTGVWLWRLSKAHVLAHDSGYHQLVSHWLNTHCSMEPYVIATNRRLSAMHPIYRLLHPHLRYTMEMNAMARGHLINANGIIESSFSPGKYCMELSSVAYDKLWRFDLQALPADLINRGMAVEDPSALHGLKLTIEDYPYANDGLLLWDAIKQWVTDCVTHYYPEPSLVQSDDELQGWWHEIRTVGHGDKKDEPWWPELKTPQDLIGILTTIMWVASGLHAAVNFGQYEYMAYFPNKPTIARTNMPTEDPNDEERSQFLERPDQFLLKCFPSKLQALLVMVILDVLSSHSPDEEYIGKEKPFWAEDNGVLSTAFNRFAARLREIDGIIDSKNADTGLMNRTGAGVVPYEFLKPFSETAGVTGKGVPNSVSI